MLLRGGVGQGLVAILLRSAGAGASPRSLTRTVAGRRPGWPVDCGAQQSKVRPRRTARMSPCWQVKPSLAAAWATIAALRSIPVTR